MTYYDKINNELTNFLVIQDLSKITSSYLFTYGNKFIVIQDKQKIYDEFPKEFYETSFANKFIICASILHKKEIEKETQFITSLTKCIRSCVQMYDKNDHHPQSGYDDLDLKSFLWRKDSNLEHWCLFLKYSTTNSSIYWFINVNSTSSRYGTILSWAKSKYFETKELYFYENIIKFEHEFYESLEKTIIHINNEDIYYDFRKLYPSCFYYK